MLDRRIGPFESVEIDATHTKYKHTEIEPPGIVGTRFELQTLAGDGLARHGSWGLFSSGALGARASWEDFGFGGSLSTSDTRRYTLAGFVFEEIEVDPVRLEAGLRYDWVRVEPLVEDPNSDIGVIRDRTFSAVSASLGLLYDVTENVSIGTSLARAFRTPDVSELYSEGPHLAAYVFEVGNPSLGEETGTGLDLFVRVSNGRVNAELTGFVNNISNYVFGAETGEVSRVQLPIYQFQGRDARLSGFEGSLEWNVAGDLIVHGVASYVRGTLEGSEEPLPLIPPLQSRWTIEYERPAWFGHAEVELAARQNRLGAFETATDGYAVFNLVGGLRMTVASRLNVLTVSLHNLTDKVYRNHLSRVKEIMPQAGRGMKITYRVVF